MSVNKVILVGNVGKDPETRYIDESTAISKFPMATSETYKNRSGERVSTTEWHNIVLWRGLAQVAEKYVKKGTQLYIEGRIKTRSYDDADGNKKYITEIVGDQMQLLGRRPDDQDQEGQSAAGGQDRQSAAKGQGGQSDQGGQSGQGDRSQQGGLSGQDRQSATGSQGGKDSGDQGFSSKDAPFDGAEEGPDDLPF